MTAKTKESGVQGIIRTFPNAVGRAARHELKAKQAMLRPKQVRVVVQSKLLRCLDVWAYGLQARDPSYPR